MTPSSSANTLTAPPRGFADEYAALAPQHDEMIETGGALHSHWGMLVSMLDDLGREELMRRWEQARRLIRENGITHNVYGDPKGQDRPWSLDLVPLLLQAEEWRSVSDALIQRARLMDLLLADIYGPATCVAQGLLPAELLYANPGFLRPCHGITPPRGQWLHLYGADLIRCADGRLRVFTDRTQAPSGTGYSLENRIVLSRVLPNIFRQCNVQRLAPFFIALRRTLASLAPANRENPRVVLLTPGPYNETYFEHVYLARYLGYALVQGNDLTVRDGLVFLKTLGGLQRVDVILRRVDDDFCDPLELYARSFLGVPGLVEAVREGNVAVANALGSGTLRAPVFLPFLPGICRHLLGEDLIMHSVQTWWCGDPQSLKYVIENLTRLVIKPAYPTSKQDLLFGEELSAAQLEELRAKVLAAPTEYIAQEHIHSYTTPVLQNRQIQSRRYVLRAYLAADNGSYTVMPGGMTRVTGSDASRVVSLQYGGGTKDTWILADRPVSQVSLLTPAWQPLEISRDDAALPSRVADDLFWLGRYVQRAEATVRAARCIFGRILEQSNEETSRTIGVLARLLLGTAAPPLGPGIELALAGELFDPDGPGRLRVTISDVHGLARVLRDRISGDAWRILQNIERDMSESAPDTDQIAGALELLNKLAAGLLAFGGVVAESMTRGQAWSFLDLGQRLERAVSTARLLRSVLVDVWPEENALLDSVLEIADSSLTYRRRYLTRLEAAAVVDLLLADDTNPRSVAFQVQGIEEHLAKLPRESHDPKRNRDRQIALKLGTMLKVADIPSICQVLGNRRPALDTILTDTFADLASISQIVSQTYFSHAEASPTILSVGRELSP
jgi:uncharacterized circularly permuted ATP-grasp superfamily protein/uncharacterized alpha-E superfamily protein